MPASLNNRQSHRPTNYRISNRFGRISVCERALQSGEMNGCLDAYSLDP